MMNTVQWRKTSELPAQPTTRAAPSQRSGAFASVLDDELRQSGQIHFSAHARERLQQRGIALSAADVARLGSAMDAAAAKGARESLFLMDQTALVVNVPKRTVITAVSSNDVNASVFTNIDSAVVVPQAAPQTSTSQTSNGPDPAWGSPRGRRTTDVAQCIRS